MIQKLVKQHTAHALIRAPRGVEQLPCAVVQQVLVAVSARVPEVHVEEFPFLVVVEIHHHFIHRDTVLARIGQFISGYIGMAYLHA